MDLVNERFRPDPALDRAAMEALQRELADTARFVDDLDRVTRVAGIDQAFMDDKAVSGVVVYEDGEIVERVTATVDLAIPYIPGLLAFREGPAIIAALRKLDAPPDLLLVDGSGRIHFREAGIATHIGVLYDVPTVGVAKSLLCGTPADDIDAPLPDGTRIPIHADDEVETAADGTVIGHAYQSRQYQNPETQHINPLYVSAGHRCAADTAVDHVARHCTRHKLPEPIHQADRYVAGEAEG